MTRLRLDLARKQAPRVVSPASIVRPDADPLTGLRGAGGCGIVARLDGDLALVARLGRDERGVVLRGQLSGPHDVEGALVHARGDGAAALSAVDALGEFAVRGWDGDLRSLDVETEDGCWSVEWPGDAA